MYMAALVMVMWPMSAAEKVTNGLMWPPEIGKVARRRIAIIVSV